MYLHFCIVARMSARRRKCFHCAKTRSGIHCTYMSITRQRTTQRQIYLVWTAQAGQAHWMTIEKESSLGRPEGSNPKWLLLVHHMYVRTRASVYAIYYAIIRHTHKHDVSFKEDSPYNSVWEAILIPFQHLSPSPLPIENRSNPSDDDLLSAAAVSVNWSTVFIFYLFFPFRSLAASASVARDLSSRFLPDEGKMINIFCPRPAIRTRNV